MRRKGLIGTIVITVLAIILTVVLATSYLILKNFVVLNWQLFPKGQSLLDLRSQAITTSEYDALVWKLPGTRILWSVPFQGSYYDSGITELTITSLDAMQEYGIMRLASRISELKKGGLPIRREMVSCRNRYGETTCFARYALESQKEV